MNFLEQANIAFREGKYNLSVSLYTAAIKQNPDMEKHISVNLSIANARSKQSTLKDHLNSKSINQHPKFEGRMDSFANYELIGWAVSREDGSEMLDLKVYIDDIYYCSIKNNVKRGDLKKHGKSSGKGGFRLALPKFLFVQKNHAISIKWPDESPFIDLEFAGSDENKNVRNVYSFYTGVKNISIIVPIFNAAEDLLVCLERLKRYTNNNVEIILINDASTDSNIKNILDSVVHLENYKVFHNNENLGFTRTVNRGIKLAGENDVVLLNSDARVTPRWLEGLKFAADSDPQIATVTPMSDRAGAFSAPFIGNQNTLPPNVTEESFAVAFRRRSFGLYPTVPTGNGFCLFVRRTCLNEVGLLDEDAFPRGYGEENDFCMRARNSGWRNVIDDKTYIFHDRNKSFGETKSKLIAEGRAVIDERYPDYKKAIQTFTANPLINSARYQGGLAQKDSSRNLLPRGLFVISTLTGGTPQTNRDLMLALSSKIEPWLLHCDSKTISLYKVYKESEDKLIASYVLSESIDPLTHTSTEYDRVVSNWIFDNDFEFLHIRHLAWHSLTLPKLAKDLGLKVINSFHDYYTACPTIKLLDNDDVFCGGKCTSSSGDCNPELWSSHDFPKIKNCWISQWRDIFKKALQYCDEFVTTHESAKDIIVKNLSLDETKFTVIPHGRDFNHIEHLARPYQNEEKVRILVPGNISGPKGSKLIEHILLSDKCNHIEFHILGRSNFDITHKNLILHGEYARDNFSNRVKDINPHVGAVLSIWNETWCHTLTELWSVGLAALVTDYPTVATRVQESGAGWIVPSKLSDLVDFLGSDEFLSSIGQKTKIAESLIVSSSNADMAKKYFDLYDINDRLI